LLVVTKGACYVYEFIGAAHLEGRPGWMLAASGQLTVIWAKNTFTLGRADPRQYEPILYGWKQELITSGVATETKADVWFYNKPRVDDLHPTAGTS